MRIDPLPCRRSFGKPYTTVITLPILTSASALCTVGGSLLTLHWLIRGIATCGCPLTLTILRQPQCGVTWAPLWKSADTCVCCSTPCTKQGFGECARNGGISPSLTGKNICRLKKRRVRRKLWERAGKAACDRRIHSWFAAARVRPRIAQSFAGLRPAHCVDRADYRFFFKEPPRSDCNVSARAHQRCVRMAGLRIWRAKLRSCSINDG